MKFLGILMFAAFIAPSAHAFMPDVGFEDKNVEAFFSEFEEICLPFAMHKSEVTPEMGKAFYEDMLTSRGFATALPKRSTGGLKTTYIPDRSLRYIHREDQNLSVNLYWDGSGYRNSNSPLGGTFLGYGCQLNKKVKMSSNRIFEAFLNDGQNWKRHHYPVFTIFRRQIDDMDYPFVRSQSLSTCARDEELDLKIVIALTYEQQSIDMKVNVDANLVRIQAIAFQQSCDIPAE